MLRRINKFLFVFLALSCISFAGYIQEAKKAENKDEYEKAARIYKKACNEGIANACNTLAQYHIDGEHVFDNPDMVNFKQDFEKGISLLDKSCNKLNNAEGCFLLGYTYYTYNKKNKAKKYFLKSCFLRKKEACSFIEEEY